MAPSAPRRKPATRGPSVVREGETDPSILALRQVDPNLTTEEVLLLVSLDGPSRLDSRQQGAASYLQDAPAHLCWCARCFLTNGCVRVCVHMPPQMSELFSSSSPGGVEVPAFEAGEPTAQEDEVVADPVVKLHAALAQVKGMLLTTGALDAGLCTYKFYFDSIDAGVEASIQIERRTARGAFDAALRIGDAITSFKKVGTFEDLVPFVQGALPQEIAALVSLEKIAAIDPPRFVSAIRTLACRQSHTPVASSACAATLRHVALRVRHSPRIPRRRRPASKVMRKP